MLESNAPKVEFSARMVPRITVCGNYLESVAVLSRGDLRDTNHQRAQITALLLANTTLREACLWQSLENARLRAELAIANANPRPCAKCGKDVGDICGGCAKGEPTCHNCGAILADCDKCGGRLCWVCDETLCLCLAVEAGKP